MGAIFSGKMPLDLKTLNNNKHFQSCISKFTDLCTKLKQPTPYHAPYILDLVLIQ